MTRLSILMLMGVIFLVFVKSVYAYIDPGTGSMLIQAFIAIVAGVSVSIGIFWRRLKSFFSRLSGRSTHERNNSDNQ